MEVKIVEYEGGYIVEPPMDLEWSDIQKLEWKTAILNARGGIKAEVRTRGGYYEFFVNGNIFSYVVGFRDAWQLLDGAINMAEVMRRK